jgi:hypothetical protein
MTANHTDLRAADALKYAAAILRERADWTTNNIAGSICEGADGHELECDAISEVVIDICALAAQFGDPCRYSDGRRVTSVKEIEYGFSTLHVWHPTAGAEESRSRDRTPAVPRSRRPVARRLRGHDASPDAGDSRARRQNGVIP